MGMNDPHFDEAKAIAIEAYQRHGDMDSVIEALFEAGYQKQTQSEKIDNAQERNELAKTIYQANFVGEPQANERDWTDALASADLVLASGYRKQSSGLRSYDSTFGDDRQCRCGHSYYRHFDTYDEMRPIGCKYCDCYTFSESNVKSNQQG